MNIISQGFLGQLRSNLEYEAEILNSMFIIALLNNYRK